MLENLKIALEKQKKLLLIFFLTIFIPSVTLSLFGLRSIRTDRFRLAERTQNDHRRAADLLKSQIASFIQKIDASLLYLANQAAFVNKDFTEMEKIVDTRLADESLLGHVVIVFRAGETLFPFFRSIDSSGGSLPYVLTTGQRVVLKDAEENEYGLKNYRRAISLYERLAVESDSRSFRAEMLSNTARCHMRLGSFAQAIQIYARIAEEFPAAVSTSGLPLGLVAELQIMDCLRNLNDAKKFLESCLVLYRDLLEKPWPLNKDQYTLYRSMVEKDFSDARSQQQDKSAIDSLKKKYAELEDRHNEYVKRWQKAEDIRQVFVPELQRMLDAPPVDAKFPIHRSILLNGREFLFTGALVSGQDEGEIQGIIAAEIDKQNFIKYVVLPAVTEFEQNGEMKIVVSDLQGEQSIGGIDPHFSVPTITGFFEGNFPPWKIEFFRSRAETGGLRSLSRSFYFWTILTLVVVLTFGAVLISRTLAHEMEILKIKSDFVSSVSHELKTPLTSIKALIERLKEGKVKDSEKKHEYYSIISHDTEKLTRLVKNILDFTRIDEGRAEYEFSEIDIALLVRQHIEAFLADDIHRNIRIDVQIAEEIPAMLADEDALGRAFDNLLFNAVKFSPENPAISVEVKSEVRSVKIGVKDSGIGIPEDEIDKIFDKFYQGKNALSLTVKGTGLGLTLVKHIVEAHGGRVFAQSELGQGSVFSIVLPVTRAGK
ncbi:ATP-binding protein [Acidobacteriota bacterium]